MFLCVADDFHISWEEKERERGVKEKAKGEKSGRKKRERMKEGRRDRGTN